MEISAGEAASILVKYLQSENPNLTATERNLFGRMKEEFENPAIDTLAFEVLSRGRFTT